MQKRSGKIQYLFWAAFFAILFFVWIAFELLQTLLLHTPIDTPTIKLLMVLYFFVGLFCISGLILATLINNNHYQKLFGFIIFLLFASLLTIRSISG